MGCAQSDLHPPHSFAPSKRKKERAHKPTSHHVDVGSNPLVGPAKGGPVTAAAEETQLLGKQKYIVDNGAIAMEDRRNDVLNGILVLFAPSDYNGVVLSYRDARVGTIFAREFTDANLIKERDAAGITLGWAPFFKSLASDVLKSTAVIVTSPQKVDVTVTVVSSKDPKVSIPFNIRLDLKGKPGVSAAPRDLFRYVLEPMTRMVQKKRENTTDKEKELRFARAECEAIVKEALITKFKATIDKLNPIIRPLRESAAASSKIATEIQNKLSQMERKMKRIKQSSEEAAKHPLDALYEDGGARYFHHLPHADEHYPREFDGSVALCDAIRVALPIEGEDFTVKIVKAPSNPLIQRMLEKAPPGVIEDTMRAFAKLDQWDYNVFDVEKATNGYALFYTTYALMYKLNLVNHFNIDDDILRNFLGALQAGYHPNPYHNATHAADVTHINYYIMIQAGLSRVCKLSQEDILAGVLAGAIHDYDHPGFNNNFHTRTNAYLSTLYNDRSILENHHCACIFEMLRLPKYNVFQSLTAEQRHEVRDTIIEMVLSTDMGNHAKIFSSFRRRLSEAPEWHQRREDVRLALSMSIKMADISNCGRPNSLYVEWAKNIAVEFYNQGDVEAKLKLSISPFMDRRKDKSDFPKGQTSFMNYIVIPMLEAIAEFLPSMEFAVKHCQENKDYWQKQSE